MLTNQHIEIPNYTKQKMKLQVKNLDKDSNVCEWSQWTSRQINPFSVFPQFFVPFDYKLLRHKSFVVNYSKNLKTQ